MTNSVINHQCLPVFLTCHLWTCRLGHSDVFELIHQHNLFASISDRIIMLMEFDSSAAVKMLLDNTDKIPVCCHWESCIGWTSAAILWGCPWPLFAMCV